MKVVSFYYKLLQINKINTKICLVLVDNFKRVIFIDSKVLPKSKKV